MRNICVFCGSSPGARPVFAEAALRFGVALARRRLGLVYGGGHVGLMGVLADAVLAGGGTAVGVIPRFLEAKELAHRGLTELVVVETMHQRKAEMADRADAFAVLPGASAPATNCSRRCPGRNSACTPSRSACSISTPFSIRY